MVVRAASPPPTGTSIPISTQKTASNDSTRLGFSPVPSPVTSAPILAVSKTDSPDPVAAGGNLTYTLSYSNTGNANATGVVITDTIPPNSTLLSATPGHIPASGVLL